MSLRILPLLLLPLLAPISVGAQTSANPVEIEVLPGWRDASGRHTAAFRFSLAEGWKTYWRAPGEAGIPPQLDWQGSENLAAYELVWPTPQVFYLNGMRSIGYHDGFVLPVTFTLTDPDQPAIMRGRIDIGVCEDICVPVSLEFEAILPVGGSRTPQIVAAMVDRPLTADEAKVTRTTCDLSPTDDGLQIDVEIDLPDTGGKEVVVVESAGTWVSETDVTRAGGTLRASADMVDTTGAGLAVDRSKVVVTVLGENLAVEVQGCSSGG